MTTSKDLTDLAKQIRRDLTHAQTALTELNRQIAALNLPDPNEHRCPDCGIKLRGPLSLAEHAYNSHSGPLPEHYLAAERAAGVQP